MTQPRCSECSRPAWLYLDTQLLCEHCGVLKLMRGMIDTLERCRINSGSLGASGERATAGADVQTSAFAVAANSVTPSSSSAGVNAAGSAQTPLAEVAGSAATIPDPSVLPLKVSGRDPAVPLSPSGAAGNSFDDGIPSFLDRRKTTTSRVIASNAIQAPKSSSDIPNHHQ